MRHRISIDKSCGSGLRNQIVFEVSRLVFEGLLPVGTRLPSYRRLSKELSVSANTVMGAYQRLEVDGLIASRPRSGFYVSACPATSNGAPSRPPRETNASKAPIHKLLNHELCAAEVTTIQRPYDWHSYAYPFVCNQVDDTRFPVAEWRECARMAMNRKDLKIWSGDGVYADSEELLEQVCRRILPRRGLFPHKANTMITMGSQNGLFIAAMLLGGQSRTCAIEDPGFPEARKIFKSTFGRVKCIPLDEEGIIVDDRLHDVDLVYVTPNRQFPTTITMSERRRKALLRAADMYDFYILEDDYECDVDYRFAPPLPLRQLDGTDRVIYLGSLSKGLSPGLRLGYMTGPAAFSDLAREYRGMMFRHTPGLLQHTAALFLRFGHYDSLLRKITEIYEQRWKIANDLLQRDFPDFDIRGEYGGTNFVLTDRAASIDLEDMLQRALARGVVVELLHPCYEDPSRGRYTFRLGVSSVGQDRIEPGLRLLSETIAESRAS